MKQRRKFTPEFKLAAVNKVIEQGLTYAEVARDLGIRDTLLHNWRKAYDAAETALYHNLGALPEPEFTHEFF